jgi:transposase
MVHEHRTDYPCLWTSIESIAPKIGWVPQNLNHWVRDHEVDEGLPDGVSFDELAHTKDLEREVKELRKANANLNRASTR